MSARVVVFGGINMDLVAGVTRISTPGETVAGHSFATYPGGKGGNQALAAHRASGGAAAVLLVGKVGDDAAHARLGAFASADLLEYGLHLFGVRGALLVGR